MSYINFIKKFLCFHKKSLYDCQISTQPVKSYPVRLNLVSKYFKFNFSIQSSFYRNYTFCIVIKLLNKINKDWKKFVSILGRKQEASVLQFIVFFDFTSIALELNKKNFASFIKRVLINMITYNIKYPHYIKYVIF